MQGSPRCTICCAAAAAAAAAVAAVAAAAAAAVDAAAVVAAAAAVEILDDGDRSCRTSCRSPYRWVNDAGSQDRYHRLAAMADYNWSCRLDRLACRRNRTCRTGDERPSCPRDYRHRAFLDAHVADAANHHRLCSGSGPPEIPGRSDSWTRRPGSSSS